MIERTIQVVNRTGLHARPAAVFVQTAAKFQCRVAVRKEGKEANAKSIIGLLGLGVNQGSSITIRAEGPDEASAVATLVGLVEGGFGES
ncbi:MAG TPA: HPr family phosphocarrier protein [Bacillota bacterium]|jgi:phosphocarrier protein